MCNILPFSKQDLPGWMGSQSFNCYDRILNPQVILGQHHMGEMPPLRRICRA